MRSPIEIGLLAEPSRLSMADRDRFHVGLVATNTSSAAIDPHLYAARLLVNGEPSTAFDLALGNGVMPAGWDVLPAGATTPAIEYPLGTALFPKPGEYLLKLILEIGSWAPTAASQTVVVTP